MTTSRSKQDGGAMYRKDSARSSGARNAVDDWKDSASAGSFDGKSGTAMRPPSRTSTQSGVTLSTGVLNSAHVPLTMNKEECYALCSSFFTKNI